MGTPAVALAFLLVGSVVLFPRVVSPYDESATVRTELSDAVDETRAWLLEETPRDAVFLGLDHESFALNAISGKKIVIERRSHANPFVDMDQRFADAAVMLYGTDRAEAGRIMDRYLVTHAYVGWYWDSNHRDFPLFTSPEHAEHWRGNGLQFVEEARPYDTIGEVQYFPVIRLVLPEGDPLFLREFRVAHRSFVAGQPAMTIYERIVAPP